MIDKILSFIGQFHVHPILVHFPIALFISALGLEMLAIVFKKEYLQDVSWTNFILAVLITPLVVLTGLLEAKGLHLSHKAANIHKMFAFWTFGVSSICAIGLWIMQKKLSQKLFRKLFFISLVLVVILVLICGYYGGRLVYEYGVGVSE